MDGVFGVAVAEVVLDQMQVITLVGEVEAAGMAQHVWMDRRQASACGSRNDQIIHRLPGQRLASLTVSLWAPTSIGGGCKKEMTGKATSCP